MNLGVAYFETGGRSWPAWRRRHADSGPRLVELVETLCQAVPGDQTAVATSDDRPLPEGLTRFEQAQARAILEALADAGGKVGGPGGAAALLGLKATTLHSTMKRLRLK